MYLKVTCSFHKPVHFELLSTMEQTDAYKNLPDNLNQLRKIVIENGLSYRGTKHDLKVKILDKNSPA